MTDPELLAVASSVLADAVAEAEFSRLPKDVQYCQIVAEKVEGLRAKIEGRSPVKICMSLVSGRMHVEYSMEGLGGFGRLG